MSRTSANAYKNGLLLHGFDYSKQAWVENGRYVSCSHPFAMNCGCYAKDHAGEICIVLDPDVTPCGWQSVDGGTVCQ